MSISESIATRAAQHQLLSEYTNVDDQNTLENHINSQKLLKRLKRYRDALHQRFVVFHINETVASIEFYSRASSELSAQLTESREAYSDMFVTFAQSLGDAVVQGVEGNYFSMLTNSVGAAIELFQKDASLRNELHQSLVKKIESHDAKKMKAFVDDFVSIDTYLSQLRSDHFYEQSEIERLYDAGQITIQDYQYAIEVTNEWKDEIVTSIVNLREYNFEKYAQISVDNQRAKAEPYRGLSTQLIAEYLISPQQTGKIHGVGELDRLKIKFFNGRRDSHITDVINNDIGVREESNLQNRSLYVDRYSLQLKALVATLKREVIHNGEEIMIENDDRLLSLLSERLSLMLKADLTEEESLTYYGDYYFNKVEEQLNVDGDLEKRLVPVFSFWDFKNTDDKSEMFYQSLSHLGRDLLSDGIQVVSTVDVNKRLLKLQEKIELALNKYFMEFKKALLNASHLGLNNEKKVDLFAINYLNRLLKKSEVSRFYRSYFHGLIKFKAMLPPNCQIVLTDDCAKPGQVKVLFLGNTFKKLNAINGAKKRWDKVRKVAMFCKPKFSKGNQIPATEFDLSQSG